MDITVDNDGKLCCETYYRVEVIAKLFGLSVRRVQQLTQEGIIETVSVKERGRNVRRYELANTVKRYTAYLSDKAYSKAEKADELKSLVERKLTAEVALKESQSDLHKLKKDIAEGKYIELEVVRMDYARFFIVFKKFCLSLPARVAGRLRGICEPLEVRALEKELNAQIKVLLTKFVVAGVEDVD